MAKNWRSDALPNLALATGTGAFTAWIPPARWSPLFRRAVHTLSVAAPAGGAWYVTGEFADEEPDGPMTPTARMAIAASAGALGFGLNVVGNQLDGKIENSLARRGVSRPRLWMGAGAAALSLVLWEVDRRTDDDAEATVEA